jgi:hypothetical protein
MEALTEVRSLRPGSPLPKYLAGRWGPDLCTWLAPEWWRHHWERTVLVSVETADAMPHGWEDWLRWLEACALVRKGYETMLRADGGELLGLTRVVATRR